MADSYKDFLAAAVLVDCKIVTYRLLSRALKVNVNVAKQMLFDFYYKQNAKKPNSVHATFLIMGKKRPQPTEQAKTADDDSDSFMQSSPFASSMPEQEDLAPLDTVSFTSMLLVNQEDLERTKADFEEVFSIHVYSLEQGPIQNVNMLSVCNLEVSQKFADANPLQRWKAYGTIRNPTVKRRKLKNAAPVPAPVKGVSASKVTGPSKEQPKKQPDKQPDPAPVQRTASEGKGSARSVAQPAAKKAAKQDTSDVFKAFSKAKVQPKREPEPKPKSPPVEDEDEPMGGISPDENEDEDLVEAEADSEQTAAARQERETREAQLKQMMEDDEPMSDAPAAAPEQEKAQDAPLDMRPQPPEKPTEGEASVSAQDGRRRGRRRVMKKKKVQDEEGYLVTREEAVWESFSEAEPEPKKAKAPAKAASTFKGKKGAAGKGGQGSIASFFKKA